MQVFLETERMVLRHFTAADVDLLVDLDSDPEVMRFLTGGIPTPREAIQNDILPAFLRSYEPFSGFGVFAAIGKADWEQQEELQRKETMPSNTYLSTTWYDLRVEVRPSSIHGMGMFASQPIHEGEIVVRIGGSVMTEEEFRVYISKVSRYNAVQIGEARHLVDVPKALGGMNHSCDANLWMRDEVTVVARRDIAAGKELTQDYALYTTSPTWTMRPCSCGTPVCRQVITGNDWQRPEVQERYRDHFSPFLNERIRRLREK